jgi:hypothetical protein
MNRVRVEELHKLAYRWYPHPIFLSHHLCEFNSTTCSVHIRATTEDTLKLMVGPHIELFAG